MSNKDFQATVGSPRVRPLSEAYSKLRPTAYGTAMLLLCILVSVVEGYDVQAMSLAAPLLAKSWALTPPAVGSLLSASLIGQVVGGFALAPLGDRIGRRSALLLGLAIAGGSTFAGAFMPDFGSMMASRFAAGLGLGLALANTITLAMELVPANWRTIAVVLVCSGYPLGAAVGAAAVGVFLPIHGVAAVFYVGGIGTLVAFVLSVTFLPESPVILARRGGGQAKLRRLFGRLGVYIGPDEQLAGEEVAAGKSRAGALFTPERRSTTLLLWILMFANLSLVFFFVMWLPSLFVKSGLDPRAAIQATALFSFSGIFGGLAMAVLLSRIGPVKTLGACYILSIATIAAFASVGPSSGAFLVILASCGFLIIGSQFCLNAVVNLFYPGPIRATGLGFALGAGRLGGVFAPLVGGYTLAHVTSPQQAFYVALVPAVLSLLALISLGRMKLIGLEAE